MSALVCRWKACASATAVTCLRRYVGDSYNSTTKKWMDISGSNNHATCTGTITKVSLGINNEDYIYGPTSATVTLPQTWNSDTYTFFHVTKQVPACPGLEPA